MKKLILILLFITGCSSSNIEEKQNNLININNGKFEENVYKFNQFNIFSLKRIKNNKKLIIYIEGDGEAWLDRFTPSLDPTPNNPIAFELALNDKNDNVIYLARPCQYILSSNCDKTIWTTLQYSQPILEIYSDIIRDLSNDYEDINLVGYSGGAAIAIYLASLEKTNIKSVRTIAGNINPDELSRLLNLSGYKKTVNFYSLEKKIEKISQIHYYGIKDNVIPAELHFNFAKRNLSSKCLKIESVKASHNDGWKEFWKNNYKLSFNC